MSRSSSVAESGVHQTAVRNPELSRESRREIRFSLVAVTRELPARPEPRDLWDDLARNDTLMRNGWIDRGPALCRKALAASVVMGPEVQRATMIGVRRFYAVQQSHTLAGFDLTDVSTLPGKLCECVRVLSDCAAAAADALHEGTEGNLEAVRFALMTADRAIEDGLDLTSAELARVHQPLARIGAG